ncbi:MAG: hypothetical protein GY708_03015 [Actinomycetia bacterium]|nr:hypothetical protein [Actinomycetes bacterium]
MNPEPGITEDRLAHTLAAVADQTTATATDGWDRIVAELETPHSPNRVRPWLAAAVVAGVLVAGGAAIAILRSGSDGTDNVTAGLSFVLPGETVIAQDPLIVTAPPGPEPEFDTSELGQRLEFEPIDEVPPELAELWSHPRRPFPDSVVIKVTLLGAIDGEPWVVWVSDGPNTDGGDGADVTANVRSRFMGSPSGGGHGSGDLVPASSLARIEPVPAGGRIERGISHSGPNGWVTWDNLPADTAAVTFADDDHQLWITPRAGVAVFPTQLTNGERFFLEAFNIDGERIGTVNRTFQLGSEVPTGTPQPDQLVPDRAPIDTSQLPAAIPTWVNQLGLNQSDPEVWSDRLEQACVQSVWDHEVAIRLAAEFIEQDLTESVRAPGLGEPTDREGAQALWLMAAQVCRDSFPPEAIETGPPTP